MTRSSRLRLPRRFAGLVHELARFGVVGCTALVVDVGLFNLLRFAGGEGPLYAWPLAAKVVSTAAATVVAWLGNRFWTFRHHRRADARREFLLFVIMCTIGLGIALGCLALSHYVLGWRSPLADNLSANVVGLVLGTAFRFWAYRRLVFTAGRHQSPDVEDERRTLVDPV